MKRLKKTIPLCAACAILYCLTLPPVWADSTQGTKISFLWAFGALTGPEKNSQLLSVDQNAVLHSGDRLKIFLQPQTDCHLYLIYRSSQNELVVMLPAQGSGSRTAAGVQHRVPGGSRWFSLDEVTGIETFYLLVSARPLENLETLCQNLSASMEKSKRDAFGRDLLSEINRLQKKRRRLTAPAERPIRLGGNFRGFAEDAKPELPNLSRIAMEISASDFYSRTFTIDHR